MAHKRGLGLPAMGGASMLHRQTCCTAPRIQQRILTLCAPAPHDTFQLAPVAVMAAASPSSGEHTPFGTPMRVDSASDTEHLPFMVCTQGCTRVSWSAGRAARVSHGLQAGLRACLWQPGASLHARSARQQQGPLPSAGLQHTAFTHAPRATRPTAFSRPTTHSLHACSRCHKAHCLQQACNTQPAQLVR